MPQARRRSKSAAATLRKNNNIFSHSHTLWHTLTHTLAHSVRQHPRPVHWQLAAIVPIYDSEFGYIFGKFLNSLSASVCESPCVRVDLSLSRFKSRIRPVDGHQCRLAEALVKI